MTTTLEPAAFSAIKSILYRDGYRFAAKLLLLSVTLNVMLTVFLYVSLTREPPPPRYFATNPDGTLTELVALDRPNLLPPALRNWSAHCVTEALTLGFHDYTRRVNAVSKECFTEAGAIEYRNALVSSNTLTALERNRAVMRASIDGVPSIIDQGQVGNRLAWKIRVPVMIEIIGEDIRRQPRRESILLLAMRTPTLEHDKGVAITQFIFE